MDQLLNYASGSSDSDADIHDGEESSHVKVETCSEVQPDSNVNGQQSEYDNINKTDSLRSPDLRDGSHFLQRNFFSLHPTSPSSLTVASKADGVNNYTQFESSPSCRAEESESPRKILTAEGEIDIPQGEFWTNFKPIVTTFNENQNNKNPHYDYYDWQHGNQASSSKANNKRNISLSNMEQRTRAGDANPKRMCQLWSARSSNHKPFESRMAQSETESANLSNQGGSLLQKRKLYFIHSKISPFLLNSSAVHKYPRILSHSWPTHTSTINRINWNIPQYSHLLLTAGSNGMQGEVTVWNAWSVVDNHAVTLTAHKKSVKHAEWLKDGRAILSCSFDRTALITDVESEKVVMQCDHTGFVTAGCCHTSNHHLFLTGTEDMILMWDRRIKDVPIKHFSYKNTIGQIQDLLLIQDGRELISCSDLVSRDSADKTIIAWDTTSGVVLSNQIFQERYSCIRLKCHPNNQQFLAQTQGGYIAFFSTSKPYKMDKCKRLEGHKIQGYNIGFDLSPDGKFIYSGSAEGGVHCYDCTSGRSISKLSSSRNVICDVACHPVLPSVIGACSWGGTLSIWQ